MASWFVHNSKHLFIHSITISLITRKKFVFSLKNWYMQSSFILKIVFFCIDHQSFNLIHIFKPMAIYFVMLQQFSKQEILNSLRNSNKLLIRLEMWSPLLKKAGEKCNDSMSCKFRELLPISISIVFQLFHFFCYVRIFFLLFF